MAKYHARAKELTEQSNE